MDKCTKFHTLLHYEYKLSKAMKVTKKDVVFFNDIIQNIRLKVYFAVNLYFLPLRAS